jgi:hypothetical protein
LTTDPPEEVRCFRIPHTLATTGTYAYLVAHQMPVDLDTCPWGDPA